MKPFTKSFLVIFLLLFAAMPLCAQNTCTELFAFLDKKGFQPQVQLLTAGGTNNLPFNIIVNFSPEDTKSEHNLVLFFDLEQGYMWRNNISVAMEELKTKNFNSSVVFCYKSRLDLPRDNIIYGSQVYAENLNSNSSNDVFIFNLAAAKNSIITGSNKYHSPSWMLKDLVDAFSDARITEGLPVVYISQVADYTFSNDKTFLAFIENEIPCIWADVSEADKINIILKTCIDNYEKSSQKPYDSHSFMFRLFGQRIWLSEFRIINSIIVIIIMGFLFVFCIGFINKNLKREFWQEISTIWYTLPIIYIFSYVGFFIGRGLYKLFINPNNLNYTVFGFIVLQISTATFLVSAFFMLNLSFQKKYTTRSLDFLLVIDTFINLVIFTLLDISLFPLFLLIFFVSVISLIFRRNWIHIVLFVFLIMPFIPYINALFTVSDKASLHEVLIASNSLPFLLSLVLLPVYLMWLRILNSMKKRYAKKRIYACVIALAYTVIILLLFVTNRIFFTGKKEIQNSIKITELQPENSAAFDFNISCSNRSVFEDIIRQIKITSSNVPAYTSVKIISENPVLYSENDYIHNNQSEAEFLLPLYPSDKLEFNYGTDQKNQTILVEQIFYSEAEKQYYSITKSFFTQDNE